MTKTVADHLLEQIAAGRAILWDLEAAGAAWQQVLAARLWLDELEQVVQEAREEREDDKRPAPRE
jgi:hypothetical protein